MFSLSGKGFAKAAVVGAAAALAMVVTLPSFTAPAFAQRQAMVTAATDGWFEVAEIDSLTWAFSEPEYWQKNISYLIAGSERALLLDSGSPEDDITFIASRIIDLPVTVMASHIHYDHIGSHHRFERVAMADLPINRAHMDGTTYTTSLRETLTWPSQSFEVSEWWKPDTTIDLGGRKLEIVHAPGHSPDSIVLVDRERGQMFTGDHLYGGELVAFTPGADLAVYLETTRRLIHDYPETKTVLGAHFNGVLPVASLTELETALSKVLEGSAEGRKMWWLGGLLTEYPFQHFSIVAATFR